MKKKSFAYQNNPEVQKTYESKYMR